MVIGMGIDLVDLDRIRSVWERHGERFERRLLRPQERDYCLSLPDPVPSMAARFAAKEAMSKALGTGIGAELGWLDMEVVRSPAGVPGFRLHDKALTLAEGRGIRFIHLSLTHSRTTAAAVVVLEGVAAAVPDPAGTGATPPIGRAPGR
jgi:holo-[acyl-carrier protein] synthase